MKLILNKRQILLIISAIIAILIVVIAFLFVPKHEEKTSTRPPYRFSLDEIQKIQSGDIILRHGYGVVSLFVEQQAGNHGVSHCGMLLKEDTTLTIIHAISSEYASKDGVQTCPFLEFSADAKPNSLVVLRPQVENIDTLISVALQYVAEKAPFDLKFSMQTHDEIYCSELLYLIFKEAANIELYDPINPDHSFSFFFDTTLFKVVIDHRKIKN